MDRQRTFDKKALLIALILGLALCLAHPGFSASSNPKKQPDPKPTESLDMEPLVFRIASPAPAGDNFSLLWITRNNNSLQGPPYPIEKKVGEITPQALIRTPKRSNPLGGSLYTASLLTLTALNIADYVSTVRALQLPGLEEGNPIMRPFTKNMVVFGVVKLGVAALDFYLLKNIYKKNKTLGWVLSIVGNIAMSYVVSNNLRKIQSVMRH